MKVLVIEDNENLAYGLSNNLEIEGYDVRVAAHGAAGLEEEVSWKPDLIILDLMLPDMDGYRVLRQLRAAGADTPVLILSARGEEVDKVRGFRFGADDYVTKPFSLLELMARVEALLRRSGKSDGGGRTRCFGSVEVDADSREVRKKGEPVALAPKEFDLLWALLERKGAAASRLELIREVWGYPDTVLTRTVDTHIAELRRKLEDDPSDPRFILTVSKVGYRLKG